MSEFLNIKESDSIWNNLHLRVYMGEVARRHGVVDSLALPNMRDLPPIQIEKLFVQPELSIMPVNPTDNVRIEGESLLECLSNDRAIILLGDPGSGKTTLINWLSWRLSSGLIKGLPNFLDNFLPLPCVLREINSNNFDDIESISDLAIVIANRLLGEKLTKDIKNSLMEYIASNRYILMLDGVDEISINNRKTVARWISTAKENSAYVVATSRIIGYDEYPIHKAISHDERKASKNFSSSLEQSEMVSNDRDFIDFSKFKDNYTENPNFSEKAKPSSEQWATLYYLMPFNDQRIKDFIINWYLQRSGSEIDAKQRSADLLAALRQSKATYELARTPNLLSLIAIVYRERAHLPDGKALLYKEISNAYINTIDSQKKIKLDNDLLRYDWTVRESWIAYVGFKMQIERSLSEPGRAFGVLFDKEKVLSWLVEAMAPFFQVDPSRHAEVFLDWVARRSGLLLPRGENRYAFVHLSFQEYFCARYLSSKIVSPKFIQGNFSENDIVTYDNIISWSKKIIWFEIFIYLFELISSENSSEWISFAVEKIFSPERIDYGIYDESALLTARILANIHISMSPKHRHALAVRCSCNDNYNVEKGMVKAGFAISFDGGLKNDKFKTVDEKPKGIKSDDFEESKNLKVLLQNKTNKNNIYKISIRNALVRNYPDFKFFENTEAINFKNCNITSFAFLKSMKKIKQLRVENSKVKNINPLAELPNLKYVFFGGSNISDISPLKNNKNLAILDLDLTNVDDISVLESCTNLLSLSLDHTGVSDISYLENMKYIQYLHLNYLNIIDFSVIEKMINLTVLSLASSNIENIFFVKKLNKLVDLNLSNIKGIDLAPLASCTSLRKLRLRGATDEQLVLLSSLKNIEELWLSDSTVSDISVLSEMINLKKLSLDGSNVVDLKPLARLDNLEYLDIEDTNVSDVSILSELKNLKHLLISGSKVKSLDHLKNKMNLSVLGVIS